MVLQSDTLCQVGIINIVCLPCEKWSYTGRCSIASFFNVYINDLSRSLSKLRIWCGSGENVINHLMYGDDMVLL